MKNLLFYLTFVKTRSIMVVLYNEEENIMIAAIVLGVVVLFSLFYLLRSKGQTFSSVEKAVLAKLADEEQKLLADFKSGKEDIIAEYERIKLRAESLVSLKAKLPAPVVIAPVVVAPVVQATPQAVAPVPVAPAPVAVAQPVVAVAPVIEVAPIAAPVVEVAVPVAVQPTEAQTL